MNLEKFDKDFQSANVPNNTTSDLPEGKYVAVVSDTELFESKDGRAYFKMVLTVEEGDFKGVNVNKLHSLDNPERFPFLKGDLITCGLMLQKISDLPKQHENVRGVRINLQAKKNKEYMNYYINGRIGKPAKNSKVPF